MKKFVIFSDLDSTLLDDKNYSYAHAEKTIEFLKKHNIPLIFCTSKTFSETIEIVKKLGLNEGFSVENGGATYINNKYEKILKELNIKHNKEIEDYLAIISGKTIKELSQEFLLLKEKFDFNSQSIFEMGKQKFKEITNLKEEDLDKAFSREFDLPFIAEKDIIMNDELKKYLSQRGLRIFKGGKFYHLTGNHSKGDSVTLFKKIYEKTFEDFKIIALGDSQNDLEMLLLSDYPVIMPGKKGVYSKSLTERLKNPILSNKESSEGWSEMIMKILIKEGGING